MPKATFHCSSCGRVIEWDYILGYGYGFVHRSGPTRTCANRIHPTPKDGEE